MSEKLQPHPMADFIPSGMTEDESASLRESMKKVGQLHAITIYEGKILDGRERYKACVALKIAPRTEEFSGKDPVDFIFAVNFHRRHLSSLQKGLVAARLCRSAVNPMQHRDACQQVGISSATLALALNLLDSNNAKLIKRIENQEISRAELIAELKTSNVVPLNVGKKRSDPNKRSKITNAYKLSKMLHALEPVQRCDMVKIAWSDLAPVLRAFSISVPAEISDEQERRAKLKMLKMFNGKKKAKVLQLDENKRKRKAA